MLGVVNFRCSPPCARGDDVAFILWVGGWVRGAKRAKPSLRPAPVDPCPWHGNRHCGPKATKPQSTATCLEAFKRAPSDVLVVFCCLPSASAMAMTVSGPWYGNRHSDPKAVKPQAVVTCFGRFERMPSYVFVGFCCLPLPARLRRWCSRQASLFRCLMLTLARPRQRRRSHCGSTGKWLERFGSLQGPGSVRREGLGLRSHTRACPSQSGSSRGLTPCGGRGWSLGSTRARAHATRRSL